MKEDFFKNEFSQNEISEIGDVSKLSDEEVIDILRQLNEEAIALEEEWKFKSPEVMEICMKRPRK